MFLDILGRHISGTLSTEITVPETPTMTFSGMSSRSPENRVGSSESGMILISNEQEEKKKNYIKVHSDHQQLLLDGKT